jgi:hypothetical protein
MSVSGVVTARIRDPYNPGSLAGRARRRRWDLFTDHFPDIADLALLDLGGTPRMWAAAPVRPRRVVTVNLLDQPPHDEPWIDARTGDVFAHDPAEPFDVVYCNSLIEHIGGHAQRQRLADLIAASAPRYWVQAPYRYFPVEPHYLAPGLQWLPLAARAAIARRWDLGGYTAKGKPGREGLEQVLEVELPTVTHFRHYFPDATVRYERFAGLIKSLIAIRA